MVCVLLRDFLVACVFLLLLCCVTDSCVWDVREAAFVDCDIKYGELLQLLQL